MSEQQPQDLTPTMQEMMAQMVRMQAELNELKARSNTLTTSRTQAGQPIVEPRVSTTRRNTLKRLGLAILGGVTAASVTGFSVSQAKMIAGQTLGTSTSKVGAIFIPPGVDSPTGSYLYNGYYYGLIASGNSSPLDLSKVPPEFIGVLGISDGTGVYGYSTSNSGNGVHGYSSAGSGVYGESSGGFGVSGYSAGSGEGVNGQSDSGMGVHGISSKTLGGIGVRGDGQIAGLFTGSTGGGGGNLPSTTTVGVVGSVGTNLSLSNIPASSALGVYAVAPTSANNYAGYFEGNVKVTGNITAGSKNFKIDHPLDPANKYLYHTSVESPDMMNIYNGTVMLDRQGEASIQMPEWFEALNMDFRYQLTALDHAAPNLHVSQRMNQGCFKIAGGLAGQEVSWLVTGIRQDAYARAHRSPVEEDKPEDDKGTYLHPELFGKPEEMSVHPRPVAAK